MTSKSLLPLFSLSRSLLSFVHFLLLTNSFALHIDLTSSFGLLLVFPSSLLYLFDPSLCSFETDACGSLSVL